ncbi:MAG: FliH/SctL family protein [Vampirovibrionales bacterium]|nr:FliH/SctL family protein [Vampirovibrionales bacterium]
MGLIKHHQVPQAPTPASHDDPPPSSTVLAPPPKPAPAIPWSKSTLEQGLAPERREPTDERRRGFRRTEDQALIATAHDEAQRIKEQAYNDGLSKGLGSVAGEVARLKEQFDQLMLSRHEALSTLTDDLAPLAVEIAERLIKAELTHKGDLVLTIVKDTLLKLDRKTKTVLIKVNPHDLAMVKRNLAEHPPHHLQAELIVIDDTHVGIGGCVVETDSGMIDASFETRIEILKELFGSYKPPTAKPNPTYEAYLARQESLHAPKPNEGDAEQPADEGDSNQVSSDDTDPFEPVSLNDLATFQQSAPWAEDDTETHE